MSENDEELVAGQTPARAFNTTHWSAVLNAGRADSPEAYAAFAELCQIYRAPLLGFLLSQRYSPQDAEDLVQGFFATLLRDRERKLQNVHPSKGKFRSFLLVSLKRFLSDEREKAAAEKRGGKVTVFSLNEQSGGDNSFREPAERRSPDLEYDRRWADTLLARALEALEGEMAEAGRAH